MYCWILSGVKLGFAVAIAKTFIKTSPFFDLHLKKLQTGCSSAQEKYQRRSNDRLKHSPTGKCRDYFARGPATIPFADENDEPTPATTAVWRFSPNLVLN
jgi:hypothetical protein